jgi:hypothetical protein
MQYINSTINYPDMARQAANSAYPIGIPVVTISGETVTAEEYREESLLSRDTGAFFPAYKDLADLGMIRLEVWGEISDD